MSNPYLGTWRIIEMEQWDQDYIDLVVLGYFSFRDDNLGEFQFGTVHGETIIGLSPTRRQHAWHFPGKGKTTWTRSADAGGRSLRMGNSREDSPFMKGMRQDL
jgi:hypothetical protein